MDRRTFLTGSLALKSALAAPLAQRHVAVRESPDPQKIKLYSPGIARLGNGRLIATNDVAWAEGIQPAFARKIESGRWWTNEVRTSDDHGQTWTQRSAAGMMHARPFEAGGRIYVIGHAHDLTILKSEDAGTTWSEPATLTSGQSWHQAPCNVHYHAGRVYLVMERITDPSLREWPVSVMAPVLMSAPIEADLTKRESWVFSSELVFRDALAMAGRPQLLGVPFFARGATAPEGERDRRNMASIGWLETNVVQFHDPGHVWHDPSGRTFHLWMRAHTGGTNFACIAKALESEDRRQVTVSLERAPSGEQMLYVPCPGGHLKFHILRDEPSGLFWLLSSQSTDSMRKPSALGPERYNLPNNERHRLALHYSVNCVDWRYAGLVAAGGSPKQARHYASMVVDGDDLCILSRSGDERAANAHDGNLITFHRVRSFRRLVE